MLQFTNSTHDTKIKNYSKLFHFKTGHELKAYHENYKQKCLLQCICITTHKIVVCRVRQWVIDNKVKTEQCTNGDWVSYIFSLTTQFSNYTIIWRNSQIFNGSLDESDSQKISESRDQISCFNYTWIKRL